MPQQTGQAAYAAEVSNNLAMIGHTHAVRVPCTTVKVDSVRVPCDDADMENGSTVGAKFRALVKRSGLNYRALAKAAEFSAASGIQQYVAAHRTAPIKVEVAVRFAKALVGKGSPPIEREEVMALAGIPEANATPFQMEGPSAQRMRDDLPILGTCLGAAKIVDGEAIEQTMLNTGEIVRYARRPVILDGDSDAYGLTVHGSSMHPVHAEGATILASRKRTPRVGDDVVVYLRPKNDEDDGDRARAVLVKRLVRRTAAYTELQQFTPELVFRIDSSEILRIDRVFTLGDLID